MHKHYVINGLVEFQPASSQLRNLHNPDHVVILNSPAGRCLLLLIEKAGMIVTQQEFMDTVWKERGMLVSPNTYYQNICILRKGLKKVGFSNDPIVTIPRIGLTLASDLQVTIKEVVGVQLVAVEASSDVAENSESPLASEPELALPLEAAPGSADAINMPLTKPTILPSAMVRYRAILLMAVFFLFSFLAGVGIANFWASQKSGYFEKHRFITTTEGCRFFLATDNDSDDQQDKLLTYEEKFKGSCKSYPWVYISRLSTLPRASVIRCDKPMTEPNYCISDYFIGES